LVPGMTREEAAEALAAAGGVSQKAAGLSGLPRHLFQ
jgi:hypothetical protein